MNLDPYSIPEYGKLAFQCPYCGLHTQMLWSTLKIRDPHISVAICQNCKKSSIWTDNQMIHPQVGISPPPHKMMPQRVLKYYEIARVVSQNLPAVSCSFLRLAMRELFIILGESGSDFGEAIENLISRKFGNRNFWKPMFTSHLTGFDVIKPGVVDDRDNVVTMNHLFNFINHIIQEVIENPIHLAQFYAKLSDPRKEKINPNFFQRS